MLRAPLSSIVSMHLESGVKKVQSDFQCGLPMRMSFRMRLKRGHLDIHLFATCRMSSFHQFHHQVDCKVNQNLLLPTRNCVFLHGFHRFWHSASARFFSWNRAGKSKTMHKKQLLTLVSVHHWEKKNVAFIQNHRGELGLKKPCLKFRRSTVQVWSSVSEIAYTLWGMVLLQLRLCLKHVSDKTAHRT